MPDSAYLAELLPTKKPHAFAIQAFRQINGSFIDDNEFLAENIEKLIKKIEAEEYQLILPDFLFTNTIIDVAEANEAAVKKYLTEKLLPSLDLSKETHQIDTFILTQHQGKSKVQLSAIEKSLLAPIQKAIEEQKITITHISPLSWTIKSVVSLEPSLSTIQIGGMLYLAQHYIGVDQTISFKIEETANIIETVKTLKGAEPNIQTMYLLTNALIENDIKEKLSGTLPIQQLANFAEEQEGIPSYLKQIIESGAKTFDIADYPVPKFSLGKYQVVQESVPAAVTTTPVEPVPEKKEPMPNVTLPTPTMPQPTEPITAPTPPAPVTPVAPKVAVPITTPAPVITQPITPAAPTSPVTPVTTTTPIMPAAPVITPAPAPVTPVTPVTPKPITPAPSAQVTIEKPVITATPVSATVSPTPVVTPAVAPAAIPMTAPKVAPVMPAAPAISPRPVIKNTAGGGSMMKVIGITLGALVATVALGIAIGFAILTLTDKKGNSLNHNPVVQTSPTTSTLPVPSPIPSPIASTPSASSSATVVTAATKAKLKVLVVNATKISGRAGKIKSLLTSAGYKSVDTGNAKGDYASQPGYFALMATNDSALLSSLQKDTKLNLTYSADKSTEDPQSAYDIVIVLAQ